MKYLYIITLGLFFTSCCSTAKISNAGCNENEQFKAAFFLNIESVKKLIDKNQNQEFRNSLRFISKYAHVSFESMLNYSNTYPMESFKEDYKNWLKWYEENRCNNIQF